ncbi:hypothetical protein SDC9_86005 [bioreactor metagenome]|uniref:DUF1659 domain-containing protein n=1 Tax=bioreactor metagenome TaxID=1076179 RepID=A0A644ZES0_9ZZZZ
MAAVAIPQPSSLNLKFVVGVVDGKTVYMSRSYSRVSPTATDEAVHNVGVTLFTLTDYGPGSITRTDKSELIEGV